MGDNKNMDSGEYPLLIKKSGYPSSLSPVPESHAHFVHNNLRLLDEFIRNFCYPHIHHQFNLFRLVEFLI